VPDENTKPAPIPAIAISLPSAVHLAQLLERARSSYAGRVLEVEEMHYAGGQWPQGRALYRDLRQFEADIAGLIRMTCEAMGVAPPHA
jgi:hypothetical protein